MKILVIGSGGREHAICWKLKSSPQVDKVYCAPGNAGIANVAECVDIKVSELDKLADFAEKNKVDLTIVGPEAPLCDGIVDIFNQRNLLVFGPDKEAAQLEGSKDYAKEFMIKYDIPTGKSETFVNKDLAIEYVKKEFSAGVKGIVIKADGLAAGKGVLVAENAPDAIDFLGECFGGTFGESGTKVLVEECLYGEEASILALTDGKTIIPLVSSQDHKRAYDNDEGPNTGGMGAYSPAPVVTKEIMLDIDKNILKNFLKGIQEEKLNFNGVIFVGIMVTENGPKVLEFNVRFGDPEIQPVLRRFTGDFADALKKTAERKLDQVNLTWTKEPAVSVVVASGGYPGTYVKNCKITGIEKAEQTGCVVFHAGTSFNDQGELINTGGRVLGVTATGKDIETAITNAYKGVKKINFKDCFCRNDIGKKALKY